MEEQKVIRATRRLHQAETELKVRKKLYKSGKLWLAASLATAALGVSLVGSGVSASADTENPATNSQTTTAVTTAGNSKQVVIGSDNQSVSQTDQTTSQTTATVNPAETTKDDSKTSVEVPQQSAAAHTDESIQPQNDTNVTHEESTAATSDETEAVSKTGQSNTKTNSTDETTQDEQVTQLGSATSDQVKNAKVEATNNFKATGKTQKVTAAEATTPTIVEKGTYGTAAWDIDSNGLLTLHAGTIDGQKYLYTQFSSPVKSIYVDPNVTVAATAGSGIFGNLHDVTSIDASNLDTSLMKSFGGMFVSDTSLTSLNISGLNTSNATTLVNMFMNDASLSSVDVSSFDTSKVVSMKNMFSGSGIQSLDLSNFDMTNVTDATDMLAKTPNLWDLKLGANDILTGVNLSEAPAQVLRFRQVQTERLPSLLHGRKLVVVVSLHQLAKPSLQLVL
ncbi:BspA family leucine-rich repeat surface protein [Secundilactobacillus odoratitofui]|uniref:BspA family leucine-rich repeat surface protein n=1 Tax=Secundilactobacillus odoratitofui TaxID=480930 RepID=UPI0006D2AFFA|nr:BspA family leucine-rich repeat surface protein [Secundilactobacillus odoratitofui]